MSRRCRSLATFEDGFGTISTTTSFWLGLKKMYAVLASMGVRANEGRLSYQLWNLTITPYSDYSIFNNVRPRCAARHFLSIDVLSLSRAQATLRDAAGGWQLTWKRRPNSTTEGYLAGNVTGQSLRYPVPQVPCIPAVAAQFEYTSSTFNFTTWDTMSASDRAAHAACETLYNAGTNTSYNISYEFTGGWWFDRCVARARSPPTSAEHSAQG